MKTTTRPLPLDPHRQGMFEALVAHLDPDRLRDLLVRLIEIPSPTGDEREISAFMARHLAHEVGVSAQYMPISDRTGNVHARLAGTSDGADLLLYSPIDTHVEPDRDRPWIGPDLLPDLVPHARVDGDLVYGLGASNPKCMVAALTEVVHAAKDADLELVGDLTLAFAGGGMPWLASGRDHAGLSSGVTQLLTRGLYPDYCVLLKPRFGVWPEEPGMAWFKVSVRGTFGYAGFKRGTPGVRSSIVPAATVIQELEAWLPEYTARNTAGCVEPEAWISAVRAGDPDKPAFPSATTELYLDLRINPRTSPAQVRHQFDAFMRDLRRRHPDLEVDWEMFASVPGGATDPGNWIIQSAQRGYEQETGAAYTDIPYQAGQTDGAIIRALGVPTARVGYPWDLAPPGISEGLGGMGVASIANTLRGARVVAYTVIDTLTRTRKELGLP